MYKVYCKFSEVECAFKVLHKTNTNRDPLLKVKGSTLMYMHIFCMFHTLLVPLFWQSIRTICSHCIIHTR